jgi:hypothetical protein
VAAVAGAVLGDVLAAGVAAAPVDFEEAAAVGVEGACTAAVFAPSVFEAGAAGWAGAGDCAKAKPESAENTVTAMVDLMVMRSSPGSQFECRGGLRRS